MYFYQSNVTFQNTLFEIMYIKTVGRKAFCSVGEIFVFAVLSVTVKNACIDFAKTSRSNTFLSIPVEILR